MEQPRWNPHIPPYIPMQTPGEWERRCLRRQGNFAGALMLANTAGLSLTFNLVAILLVLTGVIGRSQIMQPLIGLSKIQYLLVYAGVYTVAMLLPVVLVAWCGRRRYCPLSPARRVNGIDAFLAIIACIGICMLSNVIAMYVMAFLERFGVSSPETPDLLERTPEGFALYLTVFAVLPALIEEAVMRGYLLRELRPFGDPAAIFMSALLFGLMHGKIQQIPFAFVAGLALGWLYAATDNIWLPVTVHFCNNALSVMIDYLGTGMSDEGYAQCNWLIIRMLIVLGLLALIVLLVRRSELLKIRSCSRTFLTEGQRWKTMFSSPVLLIALILLVLKAVVEVL